MLIIGLSGVTCSGKTTLALEIKKLTPNCHVISQDDYFRQVDDPKHKWIPELNHINFDILTSLDMEKMYLDIQEYIRNQYSSNGKPTTSENLEEELCEKIKKLNLNILIIEGFCIFNHPPISNLCNLKYFLTLSKEECFSRRIKRTYEPPDCPGYFEICVWPEYQKMIGEIKNSVKDIQYMDNGSPDSFKSILKLILLDIINYSQ